MQLSEVTTARTMSSLVSRWATALTCRSVRRNRPLMVLLLTGAFVTLMTVANVRDAASKQPLSKRFLPSEEADIAAATVFRLVQQPWRQGDETARALFSYLEHPEPCCRRLTQLGSGEGTPDVCMDPTRAPGGPICLVYSFAPVGELSFEQTMASRGCEVHAFDSHWTGAEGRQSNGVFLHRLQLAGENDTDSSGRKQAPFSQVQRELGHSDRAVNYLRVDVAGGEWSWLDSEEDEQALRHVQQLGMTVYFNDLAGIEETSKRNRNYMLKWYFDTFGQLHDLDFCLSSSREHFSNPRRRKIPGVADEKATIWELVWVRRRTVQ